MEQRINLASDFYLFDTPGMLWPKIIVEKAATTWPPVAP
jgi:ribosome biogenesis GTPase A